MKHTRILFAAIVAAASGMPSAYAALDQFDTEKMLGALENRLRLSADELAKAKPVIDQQSRELKKAINETVDEGFVQLEALSGRLESAAAEATGQLRDVLDSDQVKELKSFFANFDAKAIEEIRSELVSEMTRLLELSQEQIEKLQPLIREELDKRGELLNQFMAESGKSFETFKSEYEALGAQTRDRLQDALNGEQLKMLEQHQDAIREKIGSKLFPEG